MRQKIPGFFLLLLWIFATNGCRTATNMIPIVGPIITSVQMENALQKQKEISHIHSDITKNVDLPEWRRQRENITMAQGDRVFDKTFLAHSNFKSRIWSERPGILLLMEP